MSLYRQGLMQTWPAKLSRVSGDDGDGGWLKFGIIGGLLVLVAIKARPKEGFVSAWRNS